MPSLKKEILKTLAYADIFDYPLITSEIWKFLITQREIEFKVLQKALVRMNRKPEWISRKGQFYFLKGREAIVGLRKRRERWSREKEAIARQVASRLRLIPWVKMVAITGRLAMKNVQKADDIDFLVITAQNRLWLTRLLVFMVVVSMGRRRRPQDKEVKDKICLNLFLDEKHLAVSQKERDLFTAHEICQMKPLWEKDGVYERFLRENQWVKKHLANGRTRGQGDRRTEGQKNKKTEEQKNEITKEQKSSLVDYLEFLAYRLQLAYMRPRKTTEITEPGRIYFHPQDARVWILKKYHRRLKKLELR